MNDLKLTMKLLKDENDEFHKQIYFYDIEKNKNKIEIEVLENSQDAVKTELKIQKEKYHAFELETLKNSSAELKKCKKILSDKDEIINQLSNELKEMKVNDEFKIKFEELVRDLEKVKSRNLVLEQETKDSQLEILKLNTTNCMPISIEIEKANLNKKALYVSNHTLSCPNPDCDGIGSTHPTHSSLRFCPNAKQAAKITEKQAKINLLQKRNASQKKYKNSFTFIYGN
jgi:hypothetical protein